MSLFQKILIANRGEIAARVIRSAKTLGIGTVAVHSDADSEAPHVKMADEAYCLGGNELSETYLNIGKLIEIALSAGCQAIHPGYGFLSENPAFVKACDKAGIVFIGPGAQAMKLMGNKIEARNYVKGIGIPMTEGITGDLETLLKRAKEIPLPILIKAAAGGGGKGMRIIHDLDKLEEALESTSREAKSYFSDGTVFIEKYIEEPRHIEIQVLADHYGNVIHLFERECSIQRRHQKIIEESPSPTLTPEVRMAMGEAAVNIAKGMGYTNAGTVEFLVDKNLKFYFLEMNTRVQVEHPITEMVTGVDIVKEQIFIAAGKKLEIKQADLSQKGHAIECRIYAENPLDNFMPSPGTMTFYKEPRGANIRIDTGVEKACTIESFYDPMISKLIAWGEDREIARERMIHALDGYHIHGIHTNITYLRHMLLSEAYIKNHINTKYCDDHAENLNRSINKSKAAISSYLPVIAGYLYDFNKWNTSPQPVSIWNRIGYWREIMDLHCELDHKPVRFHISSISAKGYIFEFEGTPFITTVRDIQPNYIDISINKKNYSAFISDNGKGTTIISHEGFIFEMKRQDVLLTQDEILGSFDEGESNHGNIVSPMPGKVIKVNVKEGDIVKKGTTLIIVEAMKMENNITAPSDGVVEKINVSSGDKVDGSMKLIILKPQDN